MDWYYFMPHVWDEPYAYWEDVWLWPANSVIQGNMGNKINLAIYSLGKLLLEDEDQIVEFARQLENNDCPYWIYPFLNAEWWSDSVSMIVNCTTFSHDEALNYARAYLAHRGFQVDSLIEATSSEAYADAVKNYTE
jgi:hypothetical protein